MGDQKFSTQDEASVEGHGAAARAGIHPLVLPTPFGVGPVNTYLVEDEP